MKKPTYFLILESLQHLPGSGRTGVQSNFLGKQIVLVGKEHWREKVFGNITNSQFCQLASFGQLTSIEPFSVQVFIRRVGKVTMIDKWNRGTSPNVGKANLFQSNKFLILSV